MAPIAPPEVRDAVVIDGTKFRIKSIDERAKVGGGTARIAMCRQSFGPDTRWVDVDDLLWDRVAGVWRVSE